MDCEKFDRIVLDLLEGELDELTSAAARRHMEHCARCRNIGAELRATRAVGVLPLVEVPDGLELRILEAERQATRLLPIGKRLGRGLSLLAGYAMRPQLAMAALLMLLIGSSLFFLRAQPGDRDHVLVTERGVPESDNDSVSVIAKKNDRPPPSRVAMSAAPHLEESAQRRERVAEAKGEARAPAARAPARAPAAEPLDLGRGVLYGGNRPRDDKEPEAAASADNDASYDAAMAAYRDGRYSEAQRRFGEIANSGGPHAANAALYEAQAVRRISGCPSAAPRFEQVHARYPGSVGNDAAWQAADCYRSLGELARARQNYDLLSTDSSYKARAKEAIAELDQRVSDQEIAARKSKAGASAPATTAAKPAASAPK